MRLGKFTFKKKISETHVIPQILELIIIYHYKFCFSSKIRAYKQQTNIKMHTTSTLRLSLIAVNYHFTSH